MSATSAVLFVVADGDRPVVQPLVDALAEAGSDVVDDAAVASSAVLFASPRAAISAGVNDLLVRWAAQHGPAGTIVVVLLDGELVWDAVTNALDVAATTALPRAAERVFDSRPLWLDARGGLNAHVVTRLVAALVPDGGARCSACGQVVTRGTVYCPACGAFRGSFLDPARAEVSAAPMALPADMAAPRHPPASRRGRGRAILVATSLAAAIAVLLGLVVLRRADSPSSIAPDRPSGIPAWLIGLAGLAVGLVLGIACTARRHRSHRPTITSTTIRSLSSTPPLPLPPDGRRTLVFISHNVTTDHQLALQVAADLRNDADVWVAPESIAAGESWLTSIERGLGTCQIFIALLSRAALASPWVIKEVQAAMELEVQRHLRLLPIQVEDCELPILLRTYQIARLPHGYTELIEQTRRLARTT